MHQPLSTAALLVLRRVAPDVAIAQEALAKKASERGVFVYDGVGEGSVRLIGFDGSGKARITVEVSVEDYTPELVGRIERWIQRRHPTPNPAKLTVVR